MLRSLGFQIRSEVRGTGRPRTVLIPILPWAWPGSDHQMFIIKPPQNWSHWSSIARRKVSSFHQSLFWALENIANFYVCMPRSSPFGSWVNYLGDFATIIGTEKIRSIGKVNTNNDTEWTNNYKNCWIEESSFCYSTKERFLKFHNGTFDLELLMKLSKGLKKPKWK